MRIPFIGPAYKSRSLAVSAQRAVNLYLESTENKDGKSAAMLIGTPGMRTFTTLPGQGGIRGIFPLSNGFLLAVQGASVYRVNASGAATLLGALETNAGPVSIDENGQMAALADGARRYSVDMKTGAVATIGTKPADRVACIDGYFCFNVPQTGEFEVTDLYSTTIDDTSFATAEGLPDKLVTLIADRRELWLFGAISTEVWQNTDNVDFPFARIPAAFIQAGCAAPHSVARIDNSLMWLGADERGSGMVWRADGYRAARISTHAIEREIQSYPTIADATAFSYQQDGHQFYVLSFPAADRTWCYDAATGEWHERGWFDANNIQRRHRPSCACAFNGAVVVGDHSSGLIAFYDLDTYTENGTPIRRIRAAQTIADDDYRRLAFPVLQIDMDVGVGVLAGQGSDPQAMLRWSDDGGRTWSGEVWAPIGRLGEYQTRARWRRLGSARSRVFELTIADPVKVSILGASAQVV